MAITRKSRGFRRTSDLVETRIRKATESRGFAESRLLTHWAEIAGPDIAAVARPVEVKYARGSFGATLVLLTTGAHAPVLKMQVPQIRDRVNAVYGYNAIAQVRVTQTAPTGFAEGQVQFTAPAQAPKAPDPQTTARAAEAAADVTDPGLRAALERLGARVIAKNTGE